MAKHGVAVLLALALMTTVLTDANSQSPAEEISARAAIDAAFQSTHEVDIARGLDAEASLTNWPGSFVDTYGERKRVRGFLLMRKSEAIAARLNASQVRSHPDAKLALAAAMQALELLDPNSNPVDHAYALNTVGRAYWLTPTGDAASDNMRALASFSDAEAFASLAGDRALWGQIGLERAALMEEIDAGDQDRFTRAIDGYVAALGRFEADEGVVLRAQNFERLGGLYSRRGHTGDLDASIDAYRQSVTFYRKMPGGEPHSVNAHLQLAVLLFFRGQQEAGPDTLATIAEAAAARRQSSPTHLRDTWFYATNLQIHATYIQYDESQWDPIIPLAKEIMDSWRRGDPIEPLVNAALYGGAALIAQRSGNVVANAERAASYFDRAIAESVGKVEPEQMRQLEGLRSAVLAMTGQSKKLDAVVLNSCDDLPVFVIQWMTHIQSSRPYDPSLLLAARRAIELCAIDPKSPAGSGQRFTQLGLLYFGLFIADPKADDTLLDRATEYTLLALQERDVREDKRLVASINAMIAWISIARQPGQQTTSAVEFVNAASKSAHRVSLPDGTYSVMLAMLSAASNAELGKLDEAQHDIDEGASTIDRLIGAGISEREIRHAQRAARLLFDVGAAVALLRDDPAAAFTYVERSRAQLLRAAVRIDEAGLPPPKHARLLALRSDVQRREAELSASARPTIAALNEAQSLRQQAADILAQARGSGVASAETPIFALVISDLQSAVLVRSRGTTQATTIEKVDANQLDQALRDWRSTYVSEDMTRGIADFRRRFEPTLGKAIRASLDRAGIAPGSRIALMPEAGLSLLPLALLRDAKGRTLLDDYQVVLTPSEYALSVAEARSRQPSSDRFVAYWNDTLQLSEAESELAGMAFPEANRRILHGGGMASPQAALQELSTASYWHFSTHGFFDWDEPSRSGLILSPHTTVSLADLTKSGQVLGRPRLIVLSACETGLADITHDPNEFIGLPAAFIESGGAGVVASLWPVDDTAATLLIVKFYRLLRHERMAPPEALRRAQVWLRDAQRSDLNQLLTEAQQDVPDANIDELKIAIADFEGDHPFGDPTYWGAWVYYGA